VQLFASIDLGAPSQEKQAQTTRKGAGTPTTTTWMPPLVDEECLPTGSNYF